MNENKYFKTGIYNELFKKILNYIFKDDENSIIIKQDINAEIIIEYQILLSYNIKNKIIKSIHALIESLQKENNSKFKYWKDETKISINYYDKHFLKSTTSIEAEENNFQTLECTIKEIGVFFDILKKVPEKGLNIKYGKEYLNKIIGKPRNPFEIEQLNQYLKEYNNLDNEFNDKIIKLKEENLKNREQLLIELENNLNKKINELKNFYKIKIDKLQKKIFN